jgi:endonuclease YncB( thermonuclease family)
VRKLLLAVPAVVLFVPACGQAVGVDMPAETHTLPTSQPTVEPAAPVATAEPEPRGDEFVVTYIEDGDTIEVNTGERVRLIGIDTPEQSECGFEDASQRMEEQTLGETVTLTPGAQDDVDRYGRLLRYVDVADVDAGELMLMSGFAIPRYNSTDGYGEHDREALYEAAYEVGEAAEKFNPCDDEPPPIIEEQEAPVDGGQLLPPPASGPDLDCSDFSEPVDTSGGDPHGLDRDHDGVGCE